MTIRLVALFSIATLVTACGGSSNPAPGNPPPPPASLVIDATTAKPAARAGYDATQRSVDAGSQLGSTGFVAAAPGSVNSDVGRDVVGKLQSALQKVPFGPEVTDCAVTGTVTLSGDIASPLGLTAGDRINVESANCDDGLGQVTNGRIEFTVSAFSGDLLQGLFQITMDVVLINMQLTTANDMITSNGDTSVTLDTTGNPLLSTTISGNSINTTTSTRSDTLSNFSTLQTVDVSVMPEPYTLTASGTVDSSELDGVFVYTTPVTFQGVGSNNPFAGELLITGANGSTVRLIALDDANVRIETDDNGDGTVDSTEDTTWDDVTL